MKWTSSGSLDIYISRVFKTPFSEQRSGRETQVQQTDLSRLLVRKFPARNRMIFAIFLTTVLYLFA